MLVGRMGPLELDVCRPCGGVWFDCDELAQLIAAGPAVVRRLAERVPPLEPRAVPVNAPCPVCRVPLQSVEYGSMPGIRLDSCVFCEGFWMPHTTLARLAGALDGSRRWNQVNAYAVPAGAAPPPAVSAPPAGAPSAGAAAVPPPWQPVPGTPPAPAAPPPASRSTSRPVGGAGANGAGAAGVSAGMVACPRCNEQNGESSVVCWACGGALQGARVGDCPRCAAPMREVLSETVALNLCEGCGSCATTPKRLNAVLLQTPEARGRLLKHVARSKRGARPVKATPACPACKIAMNETRLGMMSQLPLHACPQCFMLLISPATLDDILNGQR